jgi:DNA-binding LacI/PurR family transcriptional regulator
MARARIQDVAERAGVSTATVSLVLRDRPGPSEATRDSVRAAAEELGYRPDRTASLLARRRSHLLGVVLDVTNPYQADLVMHLDEAAAVRGLELVLATTTPRRDEREAVATLRDFRCEALVLIGPSGSAGWLDGLEAEGPVVVIGRAAGADSVLADHAAELEQAVGHLVDRGHQAIGYLDGPRGPIATARRRGYRSAMRRHGLEARHRVLPGGDTEAAGLEAGRTLLELEDRPSAVVAFNDRCALGVREVVVQAGLSVPDDLALVGIDDSPLARLATVALTSVSQDPEAQATAAVEAVVRRLDGLPPAGAVVLPPHLVLRGST